MNLNRHRRQTVDLNLTPLIDVVFLLLIFFMVSTTFEKDSRIKINLPQAATQDQEDQKKPIIEITVDKKGIFFVNQREVINTEPATLKLAIEKVAKMRRDQIIVITADADTPYQSVMTAMDVAKQIGIFNMTLTARQPDKKAE
ncbi:MAG: biopolymer transporter ExbD [gamma proteobacterium symbiont of Bathyaustriella thionipta]|nr:biopolymer transporter ExbD [gamma proteobacterium symbiont of Bathyaustriella thionipta]